MIVLAVALGGAIGAVMRYWFSLINPLYKYPYGTFLVNFIGSVTIGYLFFYFLGKPNTQMRAFFITGILGALTTFSSFSLELYLFIEKNLWLEFSIYLSANIVIACISVYLGKLLYGLF